MLGRILSTGAMAALLGACAPQAGSVAAAPDAPAVAGLAQDKAMAQSRAACRSYGLAPGSDRYQRCVRNEYAYRVAGG